MTWDGTLQTVFTFAAGAATVAISSWFQVWVNSKSRRQSVADVRRAKLEELYELVAQELTSHTNDLVDLGMACSSQTLPELDPTAYHGPRISMLVGIYAPLLREQHEEYAAARSNAVDASTALIVALRAGSAHKDPGVEASDRLYEAATAFQAVIAAEANKTLT